MPCIAASWLTGEKKGRGPGTIAPSRLPGTRWRGSLDRSLRKCASDALGSRQQKAKLQYRRGITAGIMPRQQLIAAPSLPETSLARGCSAVGCAPSLRPWPVACGGESGGCVELRMIHDSTALFRWKCAFINVALLRWRRGSWLSCSLSRNLQPCPGECQWLAKP